MAEFHLQFDKDFPDTVRNLVEPMLHDVAWLFPLWMQKAIITFDSKSESDAMAEINLHKDYRWCRIIFYSDFLVVPPEVQKESLYHEIVHCYNIPLKKVACEILDECIGDNEGELSEKLQNVFRRKIDETMEAITQDLTFVIADKFKN